MTIVAPPLPRSRVRFDAAAMRPPFKAGSGGRFLLVSHDAGGTVSPMIALAQKLITRGHAVTWLGQPSQSSRARSLGCEFVAFREVGSYEPTRTIEEQHELALRMFTHWSLGEDLARTVAQRDIDTVVVDADLVGALAAAESIECPSVVLLGVMYAAYVRAALDELSPEMPRVLNATRRHFGLSPISSWSEVFASHDRLLGVVPPCFDAPADYPHCLRRFGFLVPAGSTATAGVPYGPAGFADGTGPKVLVGLGVTYQHQERVYPPIVEAIERLGARAIASTAGLGYTSRTSPRVALYDIVDHARLMTQADVVLTHGGLGTVAAALSKGTPLVCLPLGRDQHVTSARVSELGVGVVVDEPTPDAIAAAIDEVTGSPRYRAAAERVQAEHAQLGGCLSAVKDLEALLELGVRPRFAM